MERFGWIFATTFNSRPHKEVDDYTVLDSRARAAFNSRPHKEVDTTRGTWLSLEQAFQLTTSQGGRPVSGRVPDVPHHLSTHDLTRRSTFPFLRLCSTYALSTHDLTRRSTPSAIQRRSRAFSFNSRPHKEVDVTIVSTVWETINFQLTTSQGGRPVLQYLN